MFCVHAACVIERVCVFGSLRIAWACDSSELVSYVRLPLLAHSIMHCVRVLVRANNLFFRDTEKILPMVNGGS